MDASLIVSIVGAVLATFALAVSVHAARSSKRSAGAAERSAVAAEAVQRVEEERRRDEREAAHDRLGPGYPGPLSFTLEEGVLGQSLFTEISLPRSYRVQAEAWFGNGYTPIGLPTLLHAGRSYRVHVEHWPPDRTRPQTQEIRLKLWPPIAGAGDADPWACPCGRADDTSMTGPGHWEVRLPVDFALTQAPTLR